MVRENRLILTILASKFLIPSFLHIFSICSLAITQMESSPEEWHNTTNNSGMLSAKQLL